jgi:hypothetical protein
MGEGRQVNFNILDYKYLASMEF